MFTYSQNGWLRGLGPLPLNDSTNDNIYMASEEEIFLARPHDKSKVVTVSNGFLASHTHETIKFFSLIIKFGTHFILVKGKITASWNDYEDENLM